MHTSRIAALSPLLLAGACYTGDIDPMEQQPKLQEYEATRHFDDESAMRTPVDGTVPRERDLTGPPKVTAELVALGREKFNQVCTPCHGIVGDGNGSVAHKFSLRRPPSLHDGRRRSLASEYIYRVITEGYGLMPRFTTQLDAKDRWAVVSYVRALQRSQDIEASALPADLRQQLDHPTTPAAAEGGHHEGVTEPHADERPMVQPGTTPEEPTERGAQPGGVEKSIEKKVDEAEVQKPVKQPVRELTKPVDKPATKTAPKSTPAKPVAAQPAPPPKSGEPAEKPTAEPVQKEEAQ